MNVIVQNLLPFVGMIVVLIVVHELGHFITAKIAGIKVLEFGLGYPPKLWGIKRGETEYTINAVPLGGFVRLLGEEDPDDPRSLAAQPRWVRLVVLASGAGMNVVLAIFLFSLALMIPREVDVSRARISEVVPESPAAEARLAPGDVIFAVNGRDVESVSELGYSIRLHLGQTIDLRIKPATVSGREIEDPDGDGFVEVPVRARWSAGAYTFTSAIAQGASISASDVPPFDLPVTATRGFDDVGGLAINSDAANEEHFEYCLKNSSTLTITERALGGTTAAAHNAGSPIEHKVAQGPTGIRIGPAYTQTRSLTDKELADIADDLSECDKDNPPRTVAVPFSESQSDPPWVALPEGARKSFESLILGRNELISRIRGGVGGSGGFQVTGPVGIAQLTGEVVDEAGWKSLVDFAALISMNLAILNILPLPMLDGGRIVFVLIEIARRGRRIAPQREAIVHLVGLVALLTFAVVITFFDVARIWRGEGIIK